MTLRLRTFLLPFRLLLIEERKGKRHEKHSEKKGGADDVVLSPPFRRMIAEQRREGHAMQKTTWTKLKEFVESLAAERPVALAFLVSFLVACAVFWITL